MASPYISERVSSSILRSLCVDHGKMVVECMDKQRVRLTYGEESFEFSFPELVDGSGYISRGMLDDFFPHYPYKTTRSSWRHFLTWITDGTGVMHKDICEEWISMAQRFLRQCHDCRMCARKPTTAQLRKIIGPDHLCYVGERPNYMYKDDDQVILEYELSPAMGGLVVEEGAVVKREDPPGFELVPKTCEKGEASGAKDQFGAERTSAEAEKCAVSDKQDDPMMFDPIVIQMLRGNAPGSFSRFS